MGEGDAANIGLGGEQAGKKQSVWRKGGPSPFALATSKGGAYRHTHQSVGKKKLPWRCTSSRTMEIGQHAGGVEGAFIRAGPNAYYLLKWT